MSTFKKKKPISQLGQILFHIHLIMDLFVTSIEKKKKVWHTNSLKPYLIQMGQTHFQKADTKDTLFTSLVLSFSPLQGKQGQQLSRSSLPMDQ